MALTELSRINGLTYAAEYNIMIGFRQERTEKCCIPSYAGAITERNKMNINKKTISMVIVAALAALLIIMTVTPIGYIPIGPLAITVNMIPVAIGAVILGPAGGAALGLVFGLTAFANAAGVLGPSSLVGTALFSVNPFLTAVVCIVPRVLEGILAGLICKALNHTPVPKAANFAITGFETAFLNTLLFMGTLIICFAPTLRANGWWAEGQNVFAFVAFFVGVNALLEFAFSTVITSVVGFGLYKAGLVMVNVRKKTA